jgi:hypothetical protein
LSGARSSLVHQDVPQLQGFQNLPIFERLNSTKPDVTLLSAEFVRSADLGGYRSERPIRGIVHHSPNATHGAIFTVIEKIASLAMGSRLARAPHPAAKYLVLNLTAHFMRPD